MGLQTYEDAEKTCHQEDDSSSLISIRLLEEQVFIFNLFKTHKVLNDVWIGVKYTSNKYKWTDNSDLVFTNWAEGSPKNKTDHCVQFQSDETSFGKWSDVLCDKKNLVVCQRKQTLSLFQLQKILFDVKKNPVPIGFIYVQLPNEKSPTEIWPWMTWNDVSSAYAGVFFRVTGGEAASFGQVQQDNAPRLVEFNSNFAANVNYSSQISQWNQTIPKGEWSDWSFTGRANGINSSFVWDVMSRFHVSGGEVRPLNMAIRVWKRDG